MKKYIIYQKRRALLQTDTQTQRHTHTYLFDKKENFVFEFQTRFNFWIDLQIALTVRKWWKNIEIPSL